MSNEPAPAPSGPETPWERYMQQEWPMDRDRFNALVAAEVERPTAEWKARAEKAEAALRSMERERDEARDEAAARRAEGVERAALAFLALHDSDLPSVDAVTHAIEALRSALAAGRAAKEEGR